MLQKSRRKLLPQTTSKRKFKIIKNQCRFGGPKVAVGWWEELLQEIGSVLAPDAKGNRKLAPFWRQKLKQKQVLVEWHQFWCRLQKPNRTMASILMPQKSFSPKPYIFRFPMTYHLKGISKSFLGAPIKTGLLIPYLVKGQKLLSKRLNFSVFPWSTPWGRKFSRRHP